MKKFPFILLLLLLLFGIFTNASAYTYSGEWMFTVSDYNNDTPDNMLMIETRAEDWFLNEKGIIKDIEFDFYSKVDEPDTSSAFMTVTYYDGNLAGEWTTMLPIEFYTVKAGSQFALYWLDGGASFGYWSTEHLVVGKDNQPQISHLSAWNPLETPSTPVPEPATMVLLGFGLIGAAGFIKRLRH